MLYARKNIVTFTTFFGTLKLFSKRHTHTGSPINTTLPTCCIYHVTLHILQSLARKYPNAEYSAPI